MDIDVTNLDAMANETQAAVDLGMRWLDETLPSWWLYIDLESLDIASPCNCILGQAAEPLEAVFVAIRDVDPDEYFDVPQVERRYSYYSVIRAMELSDTRELPSDWSERHGFDTAIGVPAALLNQLWTAAIVDRRNEHLDVWTHLSQAELIALIPTIYPSTKDVTP